MTEKTNKASLSMIKPIAIIFVVLIVLCVIVITSMVKGNIYIGDQVWKVENGQEESSIGDTLFDALIKSVSSVVLVVDGYGGDSGDYILDVL